MHSLTKIQMQLNARKVINFIAVHKINHLKFVKHFPSSYRL